MLPFQKLTRPDCHLHGLNDICSNGTNRLCQVRWGGFPPTREAADLLGGTLGHRNAVGVVQVPGRATGQPGGRDTRERAWPALGRWWGPRRHFWRATRLVSQTRCGDWRWFGPEFSRVRREGSVARNCARGAAPRLLAASARVHQHGGYKGCRCYLTLEDRGGSWLEKGFGSLGWVRWGPAADLGPVGKWSKSNWDGR